MSSTTCPLERNFTTTLSMPIPESPLTNPKLAGKKVIVAALYKFVNVKDSAVLKEYLLKHMTENKINGTLIVGDEGLNGTIAGSAVGIDAMVKAIMADERFADDLCLKYSHSETLAFHRRKVKVKKEICTLGVDGLECAGGRGTHVAPQDWNELIMRDDVVLIDTRNDYEYEIGTFEGAIDPKISTFKEFTKVLSALSDPNKSVAMFCTGGIRCEKSTTLAKTMPWKNVYHLRGGILQYMEDIPKADSLWNDACFVFDERTAVVQTDVLGEIIPSGHTVCHGCQAVISSAQQKEATFIPGVMCPKCSANPSKRAKARHLNMMQDAAFKAAWNSDDRQAAIAELGERRRKEKALRVCADRARDAPSTSAGEAKRTPDPAAAAPATTATSA